MKTNKKESKKLCESGEWPESNETYREYIERKKREAECRGQVSRATACISLAVVVLILCIVNSIWG